jgi:uncharacterized protein (DUF4415 family)
MRKKSSIVNHSDDALAAMQARGEDKTDWAVVKAKTQDQLAADMASDPAWQNVPADWVSRARAATGLMQRPRENKRQVTMRFDADVLEFFRRSGRGWQGRMNAVLRSFMEQRGDRR